jgi:hypothetical protein
MKVSVDAEVLTRETLTIIFILMRRLTASMKTSNSSAGTLEYRRTKTEDFRLTKATERASDRIPQREEEADG